MIYLRFFLITFLFISCNGKSQTGDEKTIVNYILQKKINGGFDFNDNIHVDFVNDSTSTLGIFDKVSIKNNKRRR